MEQQRSFANNEYRNKPHCTRKEKFLERMDKLMPWACLEVVIEPYCPKLGATTVAPTPQQCHCLQQWYTLSDPAMENALYEISFIRLFADLSLDKPIPDHTTMMNFRHLLEKHNLDRQIFDYVNQWLADAGVLLKEGTLMDAVIIEASSSTKNKTGKRDPEMHQTKKDNQWHFGLKAHIDTYARTDLTQSLTTSVVNEHDLNQADNTAWRRNVCLCRCGLPRHRKAR